MKSKSSHRCPRCGRPLTLHTKGDKIILFCASGKCPSKVSNKGVTGDVEADCYRQLRNNIENEAENTADEE